jgi:hypothetical protein
VTLATTKKQAETSTARRPVILLGWRADLIGLKYFAAV